MIVKSGCRDGAQEFQVLVWILGIPHLLDSQPVCGIMLIIFSWNRRFERAALQDTVDSLRRQIESLTRWCRPSSLDASLIRFEHLFNDNFSTQGTPKLKHITVLHNVIKAIIQLFIWWWKFWKITIKEDSINGVEVCTLYRLGCPWLFAPAWNLGHLGWERLTSFHSACCGSN